MSRRPGGGAWPGSSSPGLHFQLPPTPGPAPTPTLAHPPTAAAAGAGPAAEAAIEAEPGLRDPPFTGPAEVLRQDQALDRELEQYAHNLQVMWGCCLYCRTRPGRAFDHAAAACLRRWDWIGAKKQALLACKAQGQAWMPAFAVCWRCYQPQSLCRAADPAAVEADETAG
jgi:hypothetical protein